MIAVQSQRAFTAAIATKSDKAGQTLAIPDAVADPAGLARGTSVVIDQYNHFTWLGFDIRPVTAEPSRFPSGGRDSPHRSTGDHLPP